MNEHIRGIALFPSLHALRLLAPWTLTDAPLLFAPTSSMWMVHRIHCYTTYLQTILLSQMLCTATGNILREDLLNAPNAVALM